MGQITLRVPDDLLEQIEAAADPETSRSQWLRRAARDRLRRAEKEEIERRIEDLEQRADRIEEDLEELQRPLWERFLA